MRNHNHTEPPQQSHQRRAHKAIELMRQLLPLLGKIHPLIRRQDKSLADQLRRAATSVLLNLAEAEGNRAGHRQQRLHSAYGSCREVREAIFISRTWGFINQADATKAEQTLDRVAAMTWRWMHPR